MSKELATNVGGEVVDKDDIWCGIKILETPNKQIPYRMIKNDIDYTPLPLEEKKCVDITSPIDLSQFEHLVSTDVFLRNNVQFLDEPRVFTKGELTGTKYKHLTYPLENIFKQELEDVSEVEEKMQEKVVIEREKFFTKKIGIEALKVFLQETETIELFSYSTAYEFVELERNTPLVFSDTDLHDVEARQKTDELEGEFEEDEEVKYFKSPSTTEAEEEKSGEKDESIASEPALRGSELTASEYTAVDTEMTDEYITEVSELSIKTEEMSSDLLLKEHLEPYTTLGEPIESFIHEKEKILPDKSLLLVEEGKEIVFKCLRDNSTYFESMAFSKDTGVNTDDIVLKVESISASTADIYDSLNKLTPPKYDIVQRSSEDPRRARNDFENVSTCVLESSEFDITFHTVERLLESNHFKKEQVTFRNVDYNSTPEETHHKLTLMFQLKLPKTLSENKVREITSLCWHPLNRSLLAVGYGKKHMEKKAKGLVCIWNIKNPTLPERVYKFASPVTCISFSKLHPYALLVTFFNGHLEIINILSKNLVKICDTFKYISDNFPITHLSWFKDEYYNNCFPVTSSQSGDMYRYKIDTAFVPELLLDLPRRSGETKGITQYSRLHKDKEGNEPKKIGITAFVQHPTELSIYFVGTIDGYVHICSMKTKNKDIDVFVAHEGPITNIEFNSLSNKVFLTTGSDFYVRVWAHLVYEPLMSFCARKEIVDCAKWYTVNPMLIVALGKMHIDFWDLRRRCDTVPVLTYENPSTYNYLSFNISPFGPNLMVGDVNGCVHLFIFNEAKSEVKFNLELIADVLSNHVKYKNPTLWRQVLSAIPEFKVKTIPSFETDDR